MTIISKGTRASVGRGMGKVSARLLGKAGKIGLFDRFFAWGVVGVEGFAGDDVVGMFSAGGTCFVHILEDSVNRFSVSVSPCFDAFETECMAAFDEESIWRLRRVVADSANQSCDVGLIGSGLIRRVGGGGGRGGGGPRGGCREQRVRRRGMCHGRGCMLEETVVAAEASLGGVVITAGDSGQGLQVETARRGAAVAVTASVGGSTRR